VFVARARKPAEQTRAEIVAVAQEHLMRDGPDALRLNDVAAQVGISRQAILHHFGSRAGLVRQVVAHAWGGLFQDLAALTRDAEGASPDAFVDHLDQVVRARGNARLGAWLLLSGEGLPDEAFEDALAELPQVMAGPKGDPDEARRVLLLVGAALFGDAVFGRRLRQALGMPDSEQEREAFRRWLVRRLWERAERG